MTEPHPNIPKLLERGAQSISNGEIETARALWEPHRNHPEILAHLAWLERSQGNYTKVRRHPSGV